MELPSSSPLYLSDGPGEFVSLESLEEGVRLSGVLDLVGTHPRPVLFSLYGSLSHLEGGLREWLVEGELLGRKIIS